MLEPSPIGLFAKGKVDPSEAGRKGAAERERRRTQRLDETRQALEVQAAQVAARLTAIALGHVKASPTEVSAANSILDRTVGKAPELLSVQGDPSWHLMMIIQRLDEAIEDQEFTNQMES